MQRWAGWWGCLRSVVVEGFLAIPGPATVALAVAVVVPAGCISGCVEGAGGGRPIAAGGSYSKPFRRFPDKVMTRRKSPKRKEKSGENTHLDRSSCYPTNPSFPQSRSTSGQPLAINPLTPLCCSRSIRRQARLRPDGSVSPRFW